MNFQTKVALHYLKPKGNSFISLLSFISIAGIAIGVMALIVVISVMNGFDHALEEKIVGIESQVVVLNYGGLIPDYKQIAKKINKMKGVKEVAPFIYTDVMLSSNTTSTGSVLRGVDTDSASKATNLGKYIIAGSLKSLNNKKYNGIILGKVLAQRLGVVIGGKISVISPQGVVTPLGIMPKSEIFIVSGIMNSGMYNYDSTFSFISLKNAQDFIGLSSNEVTGMEIKLYNINNATLIAANINKNLHSPYYALSWEQLNKNLFAALKLEKLTMFVILSLIVLVAAFNIISTLIMVVMEKRKDIAILKSIGASSKNIMQIFIIQGVIIGLVGTFIGLSAGFLVGYIEEVYHVVKLPPSVYYITNLPVRMTLNEFLIIGISALLLSFIATIYPSYKASKIDPAEGVRYE
ncbi:MAG: lipoprotein-releasing ABC transporter permease subunit [bacterium]